MLSEPSVSAAVMSSMSFSVPDGDDDDDDNDDKVNEGDEGDEGQDPPRFRDLAPLVTSYWIWNLVPAGMNTFFQVFGVAMGWEGRGGDGWDSVGGMDGGRLGEGVSFLTASSSERLIGSEATAAFPIRAQLTGPTQAPQAYESPRLHRCTHPKVSKRC